MNKLSAASAAALSISALLAGESALADVAAPPAVETNDSQLVEIVVTAEKREENLQRIPGEVVAIAGDQLAARNITTIGDLGKVVPGLIMGESGPNPIIFLRGIGGAAANPFGDPGLAYNIDGVNYSRPQGATGAFFDISRVEVLKGPQGTLYGLNTAGGAFNVVSNDPVFKSEGSIGLEVGNYAEFKTNGMANIPLNDEWALRVAFTTLRHSGYLTSGYNDADDVAGRVKLLYQPSDTLAVKWTTSYFNKGGKGPGDVPISAITGTYLNPSNPWQENLTSARHPDNDTVVPGDGSIGVKVFTTQLDVNWNLGFGNLTVTPAYVLNTHDGHEYDGGFEQDINEYSRQYTIEARLSSLSHSTIKWVGGVYYLKADEHFQILQGFGPPPYFERDAAPDAQSLTKAIFGQATFPIVDRVRLTVGGRGTWDHKADIGATNTGGVVAPDAPTSSFVACPTIFGRGCPTIVSAGSRTWGQFNFKAGLDADLTDTSLVYANIATGEKPGGFDAGNFVGPYEPEKVKAYTLGSKNRFLANRLQVNVEAFYNDYKDLHANGFAFGNPPGYGPLPPNTLVTFETINVPKSYTAGADLSTDYLVTNDDRLSVNVEYLIGKFKEFVLPAFPPVGQVYTNYSGLVKDRVPKWSGNASYDHTFRMGNIGKLVAGVREAFSSEVLLTYQRAPVGARQAGYGLTDASLTYEAPDEKWTFGLRINNLTNRGVLQDALATPAANPRGVIPTSYWGSPLPPRTYAAMFQYRF